MSRCRGRVPTRLMMFVAALAAVSGSTAQAAAGPSEHVEPTLVPRIVLDQTELTSADAEIPTDVRRVRTSRIIEAGAPGTTRVAYVQEEWRATEAEWPVQTGLVQKAVTYALGGLLKLDDRHRRLDAQGVTHGDWYSRLEGVRTEMLPRLEFRVGAVLDLEFSSVTEDFRTGVSTRYGHIYRLEAVERMAAHDYWQRVAPPDGDLTDVGDVWRFTLDWTIFDESGDQLSRRVRDYFLSSALGYVVPCCSDSDSTLQVLALVAIPDNTGAR